MPQALSLADAVARGVEFEPHEAVAIVQALIAERSSDVDLSPPLGPPTLYNVFLGADGTVVCRGCAATPVVSEMGALLDALLLHRGAARVPGALRYTIARALLEVDAPPFDSLQQLSGALSRYERGNRTIVLQRLAGRVTTPAMPAPRAAGLTAVERRRNAPSATELRRCLRAVDRDLFEGHARIEAALAPDQPARFRTQHWLAMLAVAGVVVGAAAVDFHRGRLPLVSARRTVSTKTAPLRASRDLTAGVPLVAGTAPAVRAAARRAPVARTTHPAEEPAETALAASETPLFTRDAQSTFPAGDFNVMTIVDDGAKNYHVQPSPDGARVAFDSDRDGERGIYVANRNGSSVRRVSGPGYAAAPTWAPDGDRLAFVRAEADRPRVRNLWIMTLSSGAARRLTDYRDGEVRGASWFSDGRRVCFTRDDQIIVLDVGSGAVRSYASPIAGRRVWTPAVSPDGRHVIVQVERSGAWLLDLRDGTMRCVLSDPTADAFAWSPDARRVAFHSRRDGGWGIWIMARDDA